MEVVLLYQHTFRSSYSSVRSVFLQGTKADQENLQHSREACTTRPTWFTVLYPCYCEHLAGTTMGRNSVPMGEWPNYWLVRNFWCFDPDIHCHSVEEAGNRHHHSAISQRSQCFQCCLLLFMYGRVFYCLHVLCE